MPWCPECGAEYREGASQCAKCGVALVEQRPVVPGPRLPPFVARRVNEVVAALGYAVKAVRVLRMHPSLLLLPLALAVVNEAESVAGSYVMLRHTALGRQWVEQARSSPPAPSRRVRVQVRFQAGPPVPRVAFTGTAAVLYALVRGAEEGGDSWGASGAAAPRMWLVSLVFSLLVVGGVNAFALGGYYGVARGAQATGRLEWGRFPSHAKRFLVRMWLLHALLGPIPWGLLGLLMPSWIGTVAITMWKWTMAGLLFFLAVTPFAIVVDDARLGAAMKRSVLVVIRFLTTAIVLILGSLVVAEVLNWPFDWVRSSAFTGTSSLLPTAADWPAMGVGLLQRCVGALMAAFFPLAMLVWYGRVNEGAAADGG